MAASSASQGDPLDITINEGQPKILWVFFSRDTKPHDPDDTGSVPREVTFYGEDENRDPVYCHIVVENLVGVSSGNYETRKDIKMVVDLFAVDASTVEAAYESDNLDDVEVEEDLFATEVTIDLGQKTIDAGLVTLPDCVTSDRGGKALPLEVSVQVNEVGHTMHNLCFEVPVSDADLSKLEEEGAYSKRVFAWAWVVSDYTKDWYLQEKIWGGGLRNALDVERRDKRMWFVENPDGGFKALARGDLKTRAEYGAGHPPSKDLFVYDEPSSNSLRFSKLLPIKSLEIAAQLGDLGLCSNNRLSYYYSNLRDFVGVLSKGEVIGRTLVAADAAVRVSPILDEQYICNGEVRRAPIVQPDLPQASSSYPFAVNELQHTHEEQYIFREGSAALWLNVMEKQVTRGDEGHPQPTGGGVIDPGSLPISKGKAGKILVLSHDVLFDYTEHHGVKSGVFHRTISLVEQKELDLSEYKSITVPEGNVLGEDGKLVAVLGKGMTFLDADARFLPCVHTKMAVDRDKAGSRWQAHSYCHRPLLLSYELVRGLEPKEREILQGGPDQDPEKRPQVVLSLTRDGKLYTARLPFPLVDAKSSTAGKHLVAFYLTSVNRLHLHADIDLRGLIERTPVGGWAISNYPRGIPVGVSATETVRTYRTTNGAGTVLDGLFAGNPIVAIDTLSPVEVQRRRAEEAHKEYQKKVTKEILEVSKFIVGFVPVWGDAAGALMDASASMAEYLKAYNKFQADGPSFPADRLVVAGATLLAAILKALGVKTIKVAGGEVPVEVANYLLGRGKDTGKLLGKINGELQAYAKRYKDEVSPIKKGADFGRSVDVRDSLVLARVWERRWHMTDLGSSIKGTLHEGEALATFYTRRVEPKENEAFPFTYCLGPEGGLLERDKAKEHCSIAGWTQEYLSKVVELKRAIPDAKTLEEHLGWLADPIKANGSQIKQMNPGFEKFLKEKSAELHRLLPNRNDAGNMEDVLTLYTALHVWNYLNMTIVRCPACGEPMQLNWGWCPYHPVEKPRDKHLQEFPDEEDDGSWKDDFLTWVAGELKDGKWASLEDYLRNSDPKDGRRILVHRSEFEVLN